MTRTTKLIAAAASAFAVAFGAGAAQSAVLVPIDQALLDTLGTSAFVGLVVGATPFSDVYTFTTTVPKTASSSVVTIELIVNIPNVGPVVLNDIDFSSITLDGHAFMQSSFDPADESWGLTNVVLPAGLHTLSLSGSAGPGASTYTGTLNINSVAVPEPATWALMIMGFGGAGAMLRSRRRPATAAI